MKTIDSIILLKEFGKKCKQTGICDISTAVLAESNCFV